MSAQTETNRDIRERDGREIVVLTNALRQIAVQTKDNQSAIIAMQALGKAAQ